MGNPARFAALILISTVSAPSRSTCPGPRIQGLHNVFWPCLIIYREKDDLLIRSSSLESREISGAGVLTYPGMGHMTALEGPEALTMDLLAFVGKHPA
ncbi:hypothetical protein EG829_27050 [bacterium]|nr:hypothetical protein [bacterium]